MKMQLEILFKDKNYEDQIAGIQIPEGVSRQITDRAGATFAVYEICQDNSLYCARLLSQIREEFVKRKVACYITTDDASEFFNLTLYPDFNKFERNLRKLLYIVALKSNDKGMISYAENFWKTDFNNERLLEFSSLLRSLFNDSRKLKALKRDTCKNEFVKKMREADIDTAKKSLWSYFVAEQSFLAKNYENIIDYRNRIMHAGNMSYNDFLRATSSIEESNQEVTLLIIKYSNKEMYFPVPIQEKLNKIFKSIFGVPQN